MRRKGKDFFLIERLRQLRQFLTLIYNQQLMKLSSKPDEKSHSPLQVKPFPMDLSRFQTSYNSQAASKLSSSLEETESIHFVSTKLTQASPNLFQYNDRNPLLFSSDDEEDNEPHFNYVTMKNIDQPVSLPEVQKQAVKEGKQKKEPVKVEKEKQKPFVEEEIQLQKTYQVKQPTAHSQSEEEKIEAGPSVAELLGSPIPQISSQSKMIKEEANSQPSSSILNPSKSQNLFSKSPQTFHYSEGESQIKEKTSVLSKTDEIMDRVHNQNNKNILIEEDSNQSSDKASELSFKVQKEKEQATPKIERESVEQSSGTGPRKRRNKIFDSSSIKNRSSKQPTLTPQKGVQTDVSNDSFVQPQIVREVARQQSFYPQMKALSVLNKIVDQINPSPARNPIQSSRYQTQQSSWELLAQITDELQNSITQLKRIKSLENTEDGNFIKTRKKIQEILKEQRPNLSQLLGLRRDAEWAENEQRTVSSFVQLSKQFEIIDEVVQNYTETKYRLAHLMETSKDLMIIMKRGDFKKIYSILREIGIEVQQLKGMRAACGTHKLQNLFKEYLEGEIRDLSQVEREMRLSFDDVVARLRV